VYVQKHSRLSWMSASLLLRKLCLDIVVVWLGVEFVEDESVNERRLNVPGVCSACSTTSKPFVSSVSALKVYVA